MNFAHGEIKIALAVGHELEVDADGCVWRIAHRRRDRIYPLKRRRADSRARDGYRKVFATVGGKVFRAQAHRLVWVVAHGAIPDGMEINHKDGDKGNNRLDNLEVVTPSQNTRHAFAVLGHRAARGENAGPSTLLDVEAEQIRAARDGGETCASIARRFDVSVSTVSNIANNRIRVDPTRATPPVGKRGQKIARAS